MTRGFEESLATNSYFDTQFKKNAVKLLPGEYFYTTKDLLLVTTLGSCVSACIRDRTTGVGGMNHFMLPENGQNGGGGWSSTPTRFGAYAMEVLINSLIKAGAQREQLEAKLFGGGAVLRNMGVLNVGRQNGTFALDYLRQEGIPVVAQDLFDVYRRKVYFFPSTGKVLMKVLHHLKNNTIIEREKSSMPRLSQADTSGEVELF